MLVETGRQSFFLPFFLPRPSLRGRNDLRGGGQLGEISVSICRPRRNSLLAAWKGFLFPLSRGENNFDSNF